MCLFCLLNLDEQSYTHTIEYETTKSNKVFMCVATWMNRKIITLSERRQGIEIHTIESTYLKLKNANYSTGEKEIRGCLWMEAMGGLVPKGHRDLCWKRNCFLLADGDVLMGEHSQNSTDYTVSMCRLFYANNICQ